jgi:hypothetical protein
VKYVMTISREVDGRWICELETVGFTTLVYGNTRNEAVLNALEVFDFAADLVTEEERGQ